jgi:VanZ family protein
VDPPRWKLRALMIVAAWASLAVVAYATLSRLDLIYRLYYLLAPFLNNPSMRTYATIEHLAVYMVVGMLFGAVYPRSTLRLCVFLCLMIAGLEVMQTFTADRHGALRDAAEKMIGGAAGVFFLTAMLRWTKSRRINQTVEPS